MIASKKLLIFFLVAWLSLFLLGPFFIPSYLNFESNMMLQSPKWPSHISDLEYILGTDSLGRSLLYRILQSGQLSLFCVLGGSLFATLIGVAFGFLFSLSRSWLQSLGMRFVDVFTAVPDFIIVIWWVLMMQSFWQQQSLVQVLIGMSVLMGLTHWMSVARLSRSLIFDVQAKPFIEAAVATGASPLRIWWVHTLPHLWPAVLQKTVLQIPGLIVFESMMSFIGFGVQPPWSSWGLLLQEGWKAWVHHPHLIFVPATALFITLLLLQRLISGWK